MPCHARQHKDPLLLINVKHEIGLVPKLWLIGQKLRLMHLHPGPCEAIVQV